MAAKEVRRDGLRTCLDELQQHQRPCLAGKAAGLEALLEAVIAVVAAVWELELDSRHRSRVDLRWVARPSRTISQRLAVAKDEERASRKEEKFKEERGRE